MAEALTHLSQTISPPNLGRLVEFFRIDATRKLRPEQRGELGQFFTPTATASLMASMFHGGSRRIRLLDAGAGVGVLTAAFVEKACNWPVRPERIEATVFELDPELVPYLRSTLQACEAACRAVGMEFVWEIRASDFVQTAVHSISGGLFEAEPLQFDAAILNPPYKKIRSDSPARALLSKVGIETSNIYAGFLALAWRLLVKGGELVAITPRSFCNGPYFRPFRQELLARLSVQRLHVFESRDRAFADDEVLQENVVLHGVRGLPQVSAVEVSSSDDPESRDVTTREVPFSEVVRPGDMQAFIHVVPDEWGQRIAQHMGALPAMLPDLGISVSTGRVVDFRAKGLLLAEPNDESVPLIYPGHFDSGRVRWPKSPSRKPNALLFTEKTESQLVPSGVYVLTKRFSSKEERRRVVAAVLDEPDFGRFPGIGLENHLNYFHEDGKPLARELAYGLASFLNSTLLDTYFRQFNGHTQVNATDLRNLRYPTREQLVRIGVRTGCLVLDQHATDEIVEEELVALGSGDLSGPAKRKVQEALQILSDFGLPTAQQNERSALVLLALVHVTPRSSWADATEPMIGVTPIMDYARDHYNKDYAPNTRETVRRQTLHQFVDAGLAVPNPDEPTRPTNSGKFCYQIEPAALAVIRKFGTSGYNRALSAYLAQVGTLAARYAQRRELDRIPVTVAEGRRITLSPGGQNALVAKILSDFIEQFTPGAHLIYVGDTDEKWAYFDEAYLARLGVRIESHGKMPDVVAYYPKRKWLVLIEAVTSHGPVDPKRRAELERLFGGSSVGRVYVTAFLDRPALMKWLSQIAWETEVWVADAPDHMIHFNGERFLGPY